MAAANPYSLVQIGIRFNSVFNAVSNSSVARRAPRQ
jgi:hypothetical protein